MQPPQRLTPVIKKIATTNAKLVVSGTLTQAQYTVAKIPDHSHDGADSNRINYKDLTGGLSQGSGAPTTTPFQLGQMYIDTTNKKVYVSCATNNSTGWQLLN